MLTASSARFGFGPSFSATSRLSEQQRRNQLSPGDPASPSADPDRLEDRKSALEAFNAFVSAREAAKDLAMERLETTGEMLSRQAALQEIGSPYQSLQDIYRAQLKARFRTARQSERTAHERFVWFWSNHFATSAPGGFSRVLGLPFEQEAIRPHIDGRFADMVVAATTHPAMLRYLDALANFGPSSRLGLERDRGLNENLAREILELHTLGVHGGYSQQDVIALAKILTGWRFRWRTHEDPGAFFFSMARHEPGPKTLLGKTYPDDGFEQGVAALRDLARHPSTARHLATKLARHFIADQPPERLVRELAAVFLETEGDLDAVHRALLHSPEGRDAPPTKLRLPQEFLVAMLRATDVELEPALIDRMCRVMGQPVWQPPSPAGFPDTVAHWLSPEGMKRRLDVAMAVAERVDPTLEPMKVLEVTVGDIASDDTRLSVARAETRQQAFALLFMSPEFQWR